MIKKWGVKTLLALILIGISAFALKSDVWVFWTWWLMAGVMGLAGMPLTGRLFKGFADKGWLFSKVIFIAISGFVTWFLVSVKILEFSTAACIGVCVVLVAGSFFLFLRQTKEGVECLPVENLSLIYWEEILFFLAFFLWTYLAGFRPAAYGTEKFMDYGFMEAIMRSTELPPKDLWYSNGHINYYYGGQYFAVFLTKVSGSTVAVTYNLNGEGITRGMTVGVVDERSELGACYQGVPQNDLGIRTDVLDCCPKASGMMMLIRSMAPEAVAVDEIGSREDLEAIEYARNCGCRLLATVHGNSIEDLKEKPVLRKLVEEKTFDRYVVLSSRLHAGTLEAVYDSRGTPIYESCREKEGLAV